MVSITSVPLSGWLGVQILVGTKDFSVLQNTQTSTLAHPGFYLRGTRILSQD